MLFDIPVSWEVVAFKNNLLDGSLVLADQHGEVFRVFWKQMPEAPSPFRRLLALVNEETGGAQSEESLRRQIRTHSGWHVFLPASGDIPALASRWEATTRMLLLAVFRPHPTPATRRAVLDVLGSYEPNGGAERVWAAFGIDITLPVELELEKVSAFPAAQTFRFANRRGESVTVHRYGMLSVLLADQDMATFFKQVKGRTMLTREGRFVQGDDRRHDGLVLAYQTRGRGGIEGFMAKRWDGRVWIWRCDELQRLYCLDQNARPQNIIPELPGKVRCQ